MPDRSPGSARTSTGVRPPFTPMLGGMTTIVFSSHDGFGLGHVRRNLRLAAAVLHHEPTARVVVVTGLSVRPPWGLDPRLELVTVPSLLKDETGGYRADGSSFGAAVAERAARFDAVIAAERPHVVVVDRHPYGTAGELVPGLERARALGASLVLGLRDVLDEPERIRAELAGPGWDGVAERFDHLFVYGDRLLCDHEAEYGVPMTPEYCGWVTPVDAPAPAPAGGPARRHLLVTAGGGGDGDRVVGLGARLLARRAEWTGTVVAGPYSTTTAPAPALGRRLTVRRDIGDLGPHLVEATAVLQMAGYNSTVEAVAAGVRPILVPRRSPRREQAIRASRLAALGLADVVDDGADAEEVAWLLDRPRRLDPATVAAAGIRLDGAERAAVRILGLAAGLVAA